MRWLLVVTMIACTQTPSSTPDVTSHVIELDIPQDSQPQLDLLFVIEDSPAMAGFRDNVVANAATFANVLATLPTHLPDLHVAVTTSDGTGALRTAPGGAAFLTSTTNYDGSITANFTGALGDAMAQMFDVGAAGAATAQPLATAVQALAAHPDFLRTDAVLAIVVIGASDDASSEEIASYAQALKGTKSDPDDVVVSAIAGTGCTFDGATAADAPRLHAFLDQFPNRSAFTSICQQDLSDSLAIVAQLEKTVGGVVCLPSAVGACVASDAVGGLELGLIPACADPLGDLPCFAIVPDPNNCVIDGPLSFVVHRASYPPRGDHVLLQCVVDE